MDFVDNCYLIKHAQGWFLWDTGISDAVAAMPNGLAPSDPKAVFWRRPKTLAAQLDQLGVTPADVKGMAVSHTHPTISGMSRCLPPRCFTCRKPNTNGPPPITSLGSSRAIP